MHFYKGLQGVMGRRRGVGAQEGVKEGCGVGLCKTIKCG